ncbi:EamA/RhaT family transporter, partial [Mesorhizobium sp. M00.F.Ca.ET.186.01.1.1]
LQIVGTGKAAIFLNLQPFVAMLVGFLLLGSQVTAIQAGGSLLIVAGVVVASMRKKQSVQTAAAQRMADGPNRCNV